MSYYEKIFFPLLRAFEPEFAHHCAVGTLALAQWGPPGESLLRHIAGGVPSRPVDAFGLRFPNELGVAAGFDKNVEVALGLALLGFGHVEVGTLTPLPQVGNPRPRVHRLLRNRALLNSMGFPNCGVGAALPRIIRFSRLEGRRFILGVSIGKQKETPLTDSIRDYLGIMRDVHAHADYLAINISSPNTPDLRKLQTPQFINSLCAQLQEENEAIAQRASSKPRPLLVKIAPDVTDEDLDAVIEAVRANNLAGIIATNTTLKRDGLDGDPFPERPGGISGAPLAARSTDMIRAIRGKTSGSLPIIGAGGIFTAADAREKLDAGAKLLQLYTGMVYRGPGIAGEILRGL
ncbi:quinone-dependent dihydroorotate dehydrogenase [Candidatus Sumerlaeota bacterium]|nr:quinone-dependent dihydroorotate dehydrogenase [Candidatus Sumerlaeota bacterium]